MTVCFDCPELIAIVSHAIELITLRGLIPGALFLPAAAC